MNTARHFLQLYVKVKQCKCFASFKIYSKIDFLSKKRNLGRKSKFWSNPGILVENPNLEQKKNLPENQEFLFKIQILIENRNLGRKSTFWLKIEIVTLIFSKNRNDLKNFRVFYC